VYKFSPGIIVFCIALPLSAGAADLVDPMRPPVVAATKAKSESAAPKWEVTGILISPDRRLAMINDRLYGLGEKVDGAKVKAIQSDSVELDIGGRSVHLKPVTRSLRRVNEKESP
jgi:type II secretory pathway component PulC